ncbi:MFS transporter [Rhodococcus sp. 14-2686-1-2]|nr:MFS transporter [Rhodococcus sp. 15-1189-1-1a]OZF20168.1 MFS transporter [Rhodococcus sp. 14-2686-1-2]
MDPARSRLLLLASALAFFVVILGSNAPTPLLPSYRVALSMSSIEVAFAFSAYFVGLVTVLAILAKTRLTRFAQTLLPVTLLLGISADFMFLAVNDDPVLLYAGRVITGASVALATGPAAALMLVGGGERARVMMASVSILGGCAGLILSVCVVAWLPRPQQTIYLVHITLCVVAGLALLTAVVRRRAPLRSALRVSRSEAVTPVRRRSLRTVVAYASGSTGWIAGALAVGTLPVALVEVVDVGSLSMAAMSGVVCLVAAAVVQMALNSNGFVVPVWSSQVVLATGAAATVAGIAEGTLWIVLVGCSLCGAGQAPSFASGLRVLSHGLGAVEQGRAASAYSCVCYSTAGVFALAAGAVTSVMGIADGTLVMVAAYGLFCGTVAALAAADSTIETRVLAARRGCPGSVNPLNQLGTPVSRL